MSKIRDLFPMWKADKNGNYATSYDEGYDQALDDVEAALKGKVVIKKDLLTVEEMGKAIINSITITNAINKQSELLPLSEMLRIIIKAQLKKIEESYES